MSIIKNKNIIEFQIGENKAYRYDMNNGIIYGLRNASLKRVPTEVNNMIENNRNISNVIGFLGSNCYLCGAQKEKFENIKLVSFFDRLDSAGFPVIYAEVYDYIPTFNKHFKEVHKEFVEEHCSIDTLIERLREYEFIDWCKDCGLKIDDHLTREKAQFLMRGNYPKEWIPRLAYYLCKDGLWEFFGFSSYLLHERFHSFINMSSVLNHSPEKGSFIRQYCEVEAEYLLRKEELDNALLRKNQTERANVLNFSYGEFEVVIPTTSKEFIDEGNNQHNCVARIYLPKVINGETNVVFVRKKDALDASYITCEVRDGKIRQFLLGYNRYVPKQSPEQDFYNAYALHLRQNWGK